MAAHDPETRTISAQIAAAERWGRVPDRAEATKPARDGLRAKFEREADPDNTLPEAERARRADHLQRAHMLRMSLAAKRARRRTKTRPAPSDLPEAS
jgi:hypothetical protein